jgi:hypothetical protein
MRIVSMKFDEFADREYEWRVEGLSLQRINLLVGRNATGKSRVLSVITNLANLLSGRHKEVRSNGRYDLHFANDQFQYHYALEYDNFIVTREDLNRNDAPLLHRGAGGIGRIQADDEKKMIRFQTPGQQVAVFARRDTIQHPFLEPLYEWAAGVRLFEFGKTLGQPNLAIAVKTQKLTIDDSDTGQVVGIFHLAMQQPFKDEFRSAIKSDMTQLGYQIDEVTLRRPANIIIIEAPSAIEDLVGLSVKERDLTCKTDQPFMSQGMFRALSIVIQLN